MTKIHVAFASKNTIKESTGALALQSAAISSATTVFTHFLELVPPAESLLKRTRSSNSSKLEIKLDKKVQNCSIEKARGGKNEIVAEYPGAELRARCLDF